MKKHVIRLSKKPVASRKIIVWPDRMLYDKESESAIREAWEGLHAGIPRSESSSDASAHRG